ncbi:MAG: hypothetical protein AAF415_18745 [Pseudomonadota bacterium]
MTLAETDRSLLPHLLDQLEALPLIPGRPLIAVDADEVLVLLAAHLKRFLATHGIEMRLTQYRLEGTMFPDGADHPLPFDESLGWLDRFFEDEVRRQQALPGAAEALKRLSDIAQIIVLTNVPRHGKAGRVENLAGLGIPYPVVENSGGKGPALAWCMDRVAAPMAFIDDSPKQIESAAKHAPDVLRIHFAGADYVDRLIPECADADHRVIDWQVCEAAIRAHLTPQQQKDLP